MRFAQWMTAVLFLFGSHVADGEDLSTHSELSYDPAKTLTFRECSKCHSSEIEVWRSTPHFTTFDTLHRKPEAKKIAEKMGVRSIKRSQVCTQCHYTLADDRRGKPKPCSGVSCESCHGAAKDWLAVHADYGGPNLTREQETPEHKLQRREESIALGMNNPTNLYLIARNCYNCHTIPHEKLVNVGGHPSASSIELVSWSQGMIRHNFVSSHGKTNARKPIERLRVMFIVGLMTDLEFSLRAVAQSTERGEYAFRMAKRVDMTRKRLEKIHAITGDELVEQAVNAGYEVKLRLENSKPLRTAADAVGATARTFAAERTGESLQPVDALLPPESAYR